MNNETYFGIKVDKHTKSQWSIGACFSHWGPETYLYINLIKWSICIGILYKS